MLFRSNDTAYEMCVGDWSSDVCSSDLLGRKAVANLDGVLKSRDIALLTKVCRVNSMVFPEIIYECESWTIRKAEHQRIDAFELWCWKSLGLQGDPTHQS